jgi:hypothetical protein
MTDPVLVPPEHPFARLNRERCEALGIKDCPFCAGKPRLSQSGYWRVECQSCHADGANRPTAESAAEFWNRRAAVTLDEASVDVVARALKFTHEFVTEELKVRVDSHTLGGDIKSVDDSEGGIIGEAMDCLAKIDEARSAIAALKERT